ncbi:2'-5' RNA ligase [Mangrovibacter sp. MFB070]|uniref:RNA 2',3'-cyclic phosphodiesterase n=1 Tax=Mangrovibacter sp. MFB070 TaxID=1224318 RepID=UPI0004D9EDE6|nr:RNA 2',3'-cyclic phosphodiesterase [Mangrovibacter sp. MFB070]KEA53146.1 2'-5' RNA ligase [Mangrovibacter sp. MFB070]
MPETKRLFFAIALPAPLQQEIIDWRATHFPETTGRPVAAANLHLTLAFLGDVTSEKQQVLMQLARRIRQGAFALTLDDAGLWVRSQVIWLGTRSPARGLLSLADMLRAQAARNGCYQSPQPFHPHITLWRNAARDARLPAPGFRWSFTVSSFALYESQFARGRTRYTPLAEFPLEQPES